MSYKNAKKTAWKWFSKYIRTRDALKTTQTLIKAKCCTCGRVYPLEELHAGHFIPGRTNAVLFDETGVHAQCIRCNYFLQGNQGEYLKFMKAEYGMAIVEQKYEDSRKVVKFTEQGLREIAKEYRVRYNELIKTNT